MDFLDHQSDFHFGPSFTSIPCKHNAISLYFFNLWASKLLNQETEVIAVEEMNPTS